MKPNRAMLAMVLLALANPVFAKSQTVSPAQTPAEIYQPAATKVIKAKLFDDGEFEGQYQVRHYQVRILAQMVSNHALGRGFRKTESEIDNDKATLTFTRSDKTLEVSIKKQSDGTLKYKVDLENN